MASRRGKEMVTAAAARVLLYLVYSFLLFFIKTLEASVDTVRRAHGVHPISAYQMEYSLQSREVEEEIIPVCRELGIGIVADSPIGRGLFGGKKIFESVSKDSYLELLRLRIYTRTLILCMRKLTSDELKELSDAVPMEEAAGS
ncbi:hypothetical protein RD792_016544 [Penstemon davidsonii]|uniref:NADP-dependent oxidoreductase domain-containing protein n=1 Tax=Penstemon davidsonii TaxID=160366 RepID=A0ABR0CJN9_9LAMI|nr:hypothetical protein RD792_016544 [Penstemon davidsonii]